MANEETAEQAIGVYPTHFIETVLQPQQILVNLNAQTVALLPTFKILEKVGRGNYFLDT